MADGEIRFAVDVDDKAAQRQLDRLRAKIERLEASIGATKSQELFSTPAVKRAQRELETLKGKIEKLQGAADEVGAERLPLTQALEEARGEVEATSANVESLQSKIDRMNEIIHFNHGDENVSPAAYMRAEEVLAENQALLKQQLPELWKQEEAYSSLQEKAPV